MEKEKKTILLVEDEPLIAIAQSMKLKDYGYNVIHAMKGQQAIEIVVGKKNPIDLILMDINLGEEKDGTDIAKIILHKNNIPLLFLSNHTEREVVNKTENITFYGYVVKDSGITVLDASIKMAFRLHEAYQTLKNQKTEIERKKNDLLVYEKRYRRLFESAQDGILILSAENGKIVDVNPFLITMLGYSKEEFLEKNIWDIGAFKNIDDSKQLYKELQEKEYVRYENLPLETHDGKLINVEFVSNVYLVDHEKVIQCNIRDITNRVLYEKILKDDIQLKGAALKEIQHRTKNSFMMITSLIQIRSSVTNNAETQKVLGELASRVRSIADLYSLLYETNTFYEVQLKRYCNKVIESMLSLSKDIKLSANLEEVIISAKIAALLGMILVELLSNTIKYAFPDSKKGEIKVDLKRINSHIELKIEDDGIGLPMDFNIANIKTMGLQMVNLMVGQIDGTIKFNSDKGTKINIEFPYRYERQSNTSPVLSEGAAV